MPTSSNSNRLGLKFLSLFSVVRGYNILVLIAAQYLAAIFIFSEHKTVFPVLLDWHLLYLVLATVSVVAAGYIINNFYDVKADRINRPLKSGLDAQIKQGNKTIALLFIKFHWFCLWMASFMESCIVLCHVYIRYMVLFT